MSGPVFCSPHISGGAKRKIVESSSAPASPPLYKLRAPFSCILGLAPPLLRLRRKSPPHTHTISAVGGKNKTKDAQLTTDSAAAAGARTSSS